jgi:hypothetical protein
MGSFPRFLQPWLFDCNSQADIASANDAACDVLVQGRRCASSLLGEQLGPGKVMRIAK